MVINGYPDGTFKPDAQVTYAEALKMILCALGYKPEVFRTIVWPVTWVAKAMELGLTSGVTLASGAANLPATRADVARLVSNSLGVPKLVQVGFGDEIKYVVSGTQDTDLQTLLGDLGYTKVSGRVEDVGVLFGTELAAADKIKIKPTTGDAKVYTVTAADVDVRKLIGLEVTGWANSDDEIIAFTSIEDADVKTGYVVGYRAATATALAEVDIGSAASFKTYKLASDAKVVSDHKLAHEPSVSSAGYGEKYLFARYLLKDGKVVLLDVVDYGNPMIVDEVNTAQERIYLKAGGTRIEYEDWNVKVTRDGKAAEVTDLQENDVIYKWDDGSERMIIEAFSGKVTGELEAAHTAWANVTVDGTKYSLIVKDDVAVSTDEGATFGSWDPSRVRAMLGKEVTLLKGFDGKVVAIAGQPEPAVTVANYALVYDVVSDTFGDVYVRLVTSDGRKVNYQATSSTRFAGSTLSAFNEGNVEAAITSWTSAAVDKPGTSDSALGGNFYLVTFKVTADGKLASLDPATKEATVDPSASVEFVKDYSRVKVDGAVAIVTSSTAILDVSGWPAVKAVAYASIEKGRSYNNSAAVTDAGEAVLIVLTAPPAVVADVGVVTAKALTADGYRLTLNAKGTEKVLVFDESEVDVYAREESNYGRNTEEIADIGAGDLVTLAYDPAGKLSGITEIEASAAGEVSEVRASDLKLTLADGRAFFGDKYTVVYDCRPDVPEVVDFGAIRRGDMVQVFLGSDGLIDYVKVYSPGDVVVMATDAPGNITYTFAGFTDGLPAGTEVSLWVTAKGLNTAAVTSGNTLRYALTLKKDGTAYQPDAAQGEYVKYYEVADGKWYALPFTGGQQYFGPATGFALVDVPINSPEGVTTAFLVKLGAGTYTLTVKLQQSADGVNWTEVPGTESTVTASFVQ